MIFYGHAFRFRIQNFRNSKNLHQFDKNKVTVFVFSFINNTNMMILRKIDGETFCDFLSKFRKNTAKNTTKAANSP